MSNEERIEYLLTLLKETKFKIDVDGANRLVLSYKWLLDKLKEEQDGNKS